MVLKILYFDFVLLELQIVRLISIEILYQSVPYLVLT